MSLANNPVIAINKRIGTASIPSVPKIKTDKNIGHITEENIITGIEIDIKILTGLFIIPRYKIKTRRNGREAVEGVATT